MRHPPSVATYHGQLTVLGSRYARRRLPIRFGRHFWLGNSMRWIGWGRFLDIIHQDPVLSQVKLIAEPWDLGEGGYQVGKFPVGWAEMERPVSRCGTPRIGKAMAGRSENWLTASTGSSDLYARSGTPALCQYQFLLPLMMVLHCRIWSATTKSTTKPTERKNRDGTDNNRSWNCGEEGPTDNPEVKRAFVPAKKRKPAGHPLALARCPHVARGRCNRATRKSEITNAYCQDNENQLD